MHNLFFSLFVLLTCVSPLQAYWDADFCLIGEDISILENPKFNNLKAEVSTYLQNSWCSQEKINLLMELTAITKPKISVEIGAFSGSSTLPVAAVLQMLCQGKIYAIDAFSNEIATRNMDPEDLNKPWWNQISMELIYQMLRTMISHWELQNICIIVHKDSRQAVELFENNIDFLHLDGDYSEQGSLEDVKLYLPKVKQGGYILLSNLFLMVNGKQPKQKAFRYLFENCELICEIDHDNTVLFRKL